MAFPSTNFVNQVTLVVADWLNAVNNFCRDAMTNGGAALIGTSSGNNAQVELNLKPTSVLNIATLRAATSNSLPASVVETLAYYWPVLGGSSNYAYDSSDTTSADNGGSIIVDASNRRWKLIVAAGEINVRQFGAKGDGVAEDYAPIRAAYVAAGAFGALYAPTGKYKLSTKLVVSNGVGIRGDGIYATQFLNNCGVGVAAIEFNQGAVPFPGVRYTKHRDFGVFPFGASGIGRGIELNSAAWVAFDNVGALGLDYGFYFGDSNIACRFTRCISKNNTTCSFYDAVHGSSSLENVDLTLHDCDAEQSINGIIINSTQMAVDHCTIESNSGTDVIVNKPARVTNNYIEKTVGGVLGTPLKMMTVASGAYGALITGNRFLMNNNTYLDALDYAAHGNYQNNFFFNINTGNGGRSVFFSGGAYTASLFGGNNDLSGANFGIDRPIGVSTTLGMVVANGGEAYNTAGNPGLTFYRDEITFTPVAVGSTTAGTGTYTYQTGRATRIGKRVFFELSIFWTAHTGTGNVLIDGLPFTSAAAATPLSALSIYFSSMAMTAGRQGMAYVKNNSTQISVEQADVTGAASTTGVPLENGNVIIFLSGTYSVP
jgi:hypothetical protein